MFENGVGAFPTLVEHCLRLAARLFAAGLAGALIGYQRERAGKSAGLRTHVLVAMGTAMFLVGAAEAEMSASDLSRIVQGLAAGVGFLGAGAIVKRDSSDKVLGLTTAAGIWMTASVSVAIGLGQILQGLIGALLCWAALSLLRKLPSSSSASN